MQDKVDPVNIQEKVREYSEDRKKRIEVFLNQLYNRRNKFFEDLVDNNLTQAYTKCVS